MSTIERLIASVERTAADPQLARRTKAGLGRRELEPRDRRRGDLRGMLRDLELRTRKVVPHELGGGRVR